MRYHSGSHSGNAFSFQKMDSDTDRENSGTADAEPHVEQSEADRAALETLRDEANFILNVSQFFNQEALSDVSITVDDIKFHGHKFVLAKSSQTPSALKSWLTSANTKLTT